MNFLARLLDSARKHQKYTFIHTILSLPLKMYLLWFSVYLLEWNFQAKMWLLDNHLNSFSFSLTLWFILFVFLELLLLRCVHSLNKHNQNNQPQNDLTPHPVRYSLISLALYYYFLQQHHIGLTETQFSTFLSSLRIILPFTYCYYLLSMRLNEMK